eukprot:COSAG01_NODE_37987_length_496_cov_0.748111_1_plen_39_part_10
MPELRRRWVGTCLFVRRRRPDWDPPMMRAYVFLARSLRG